jgi:hypothetical protein
MGKVGRGQSQPPSWVPSRQTRRSPGAFPSDIALSLTTTVAAIAARPHSAGALLPHI